jgi:thioesterase domain-containing protein
MDPDQPVLGLQSPGLLGEWPPATLEDFARRQVREILARDPAGPCSLAGHCAGGLLALEIARQLIAAGKPVQRVALIDSLAPGKAPGARSGSPRRRLTDWLAHRVRTLRWRARLAAGTIGRRPSQRYGAPYRRFVDYAFKDALRRYRLQPYAGPVAAFLAEAPSFWRRPDARELLLRDYLPQAQVFQVPGSHQGCLKPPHVGSLAAALRAVLAA